MYLLPMVMLFFAFTNPDGRHYYLLEKKFLLLLGNNSILILNINGSLRLGPVYTIPFSYEDGTEMIRFALPSILYRFPIRHQMKTVA